MDIDVSSTERFIPVWARVDEDGNRRDPDSVPSIKFTPPDGFEVVEYRRKLATLKDDLGLEGSAGTMELMEQPEFVDHLITFVQPRVRSIHNWRSSGVELTWDSQRLEEAGLSKRGFLLRLGRNGLERLFTLWGLVEFMLSGYTEDEKKKSSSTSDSEAEPKATGANAPSAKDSTTES